MQDQKLENLLNLALSVPQEQRRESDELEVGYSPGEKTWDLIIRYNGSLEGVQQLATVVPLSYQYAIITIAESNIPLLSQLEEVEFVEKPKRLYFSTLQGKRQSCITSLQVGERNPDNLFGAGVIMAICDSGLDYTNPAFCNDDGTTRILEIWDQTISGNPPEGYALGTVFTREQINEALQQSSPQEQYRIVPTRDLSYHGSAVAGICCGSGVNAATRGIAVQSDIIAVKLGNPAADSFPRTSELMQAIDFCAKRGIAYGKPLVLNLSFGNNYGSHDGTSLLETFINQIALGSRIAICIGSGNEGASAGHTSGSLLRREGDGQATMLNAMEELAVGSFQNSLSLQIWKNYVDEMEIQLENPMGQRIVVPIQDGAWEYRLGDTRLLIYYGTPSPYNPYQEIYIDFLPVRDYIDAGIWKIHLFPKKIVLGKYDMWLPSAAALNAQTQFLTPNADTTLTIPATATYAITVGAYQGDNQSYADFSGRGYTRITNQIKPDLVAPGVNITTLAPNRSTQVVSGTSFATPFVSGACAMLMEWGIVRGNDPYLYGQKVKEYLIRGAKPLPGFMVYPNPQAGWGRLCVSASLPD